jgi:hypothetical protein
LTEQGRAQALSDSLLVQRLLDLDGIGGDRGVFVHVEREDLGRDSP